MNKFLISSDFSQNNQEHVQMLQEALIALGYETDSSSANGGYNMGSAIHAFKEQNSLASNATVDGDFVATLNNQLDGLYRVCGYLKDDYSMPIEGAEVLIYENAYSGKKTPEIGKSTSFEDGSFIVYVTVPAAYLNKGQLKTNMPIVVDVKQNGVVKFTEGNLFIQDRENIFNFSSSSFEFQGKSIYISILETLELHGLATTTGSKIKSNLLAKTVSELVNISSVTGIEIETLMKVFFAEVLEDKTTKTANGKDCIFSSIARDVFFGFIYQGLPNNMPMRLFGDNMIEYSNTAWDAY